MSSIKALERILDFNEGNKSKVSENWDGWLYYIKSPRGSFNINFIKHYCGGMFISGIDKGYGEANYNQVKELVRKTIQYFKESSGRQMFTYISTVYQKDINKLLEELGFERDFTVINANTNNECIHWHLDLNKKK